MNEAQLIPAFEWRCPSCGGESHESETCGAYSDCYECGERARLHRTSPRRGLLSIIILGASFLTTLASLTIATVTHQRLANHREAIPEPKFEALIDYVEIIGADSPGLVMDRELARDRDGRIWRYEVHTPAADGALSWYAEDEIYADQAAKDRYDRAAAELGGDQFPNRMIFRNNRIINGRVNELELRREAE